VFLFADTALVQDKKVDVLGGYRYTHPGPNLNGWNAAITRNVTRNFAVTGDSSETYWGGGSIYNVAFAHRVLRDAFAHALFGGAILGAGGLSTTDFVMMLSGGLDVGRRKLALRVVQADWVISHESGFHRQEQRSRFHRSWVALLRRSRFFIRKPERL
jgi:hypothetical protein